MDNPNFNNKGLQLELLGTKANIRYEKKLDQGYRKDFNARQIQRVFRGHKGRKFFRFTLETKCAKFIQKNVRVFLAKLELIRRRQKRAATILQKQLRRIIALNYLAKLRAEDLFRRKTDIVTKIQSM